MEPARKLELADLCVDVLLLIFDRFDIEMLCAVAGTCQRLQTIARKSFDSRKITKVYYGPRFKVANNHEIIIEDPDLFCDVMFHFGHCFTAAEIGFNSPKNALIYEALGTYGAESVTSLHLRGWGYFDRPVNSANALFANLEYLKLTCCRLTKYGRLPLHECTSLLSLDILECNTFDMSMYLRHTFPVLEKFAINHLPHTTASEDFLHRHPLVYDLHLKCSIDEWMPWQSMPALRILHITKASHVRFHDWMPEHLKRIVSGIESPVFEELRVKCYFNHLFQRQYFNGLHELCLRRNVSLVLHGRYSPMAHETLDEVIEKFNRFDTEEQNDTLVIQRAYAEFGRPLPGPPPRRLQEHSNFRNVRFQTY